MSTEACAAEPIVLSNSPRPRGAAPSTSSAFPEAGLPSAEQIQQEIAYVQNMTLSPRLEYWTLRYGEVGFRTPYLWKWCRQGVEVTTLPCVMPELHDEVCDTRVLGVMLDVMLDDLADRKGNEELMKELLDLCTKGTTPDLSPYSPEERAYGQFTIDLWDEIKLRISRFPCREEYAKLLEFDYAQLFNVMYYAYMLNGNLALLNMAEHHLYTPHNMHMMVSGTLDLMCSPEFDRDEIGLLRELLWHAQCMGRVGNLVTTWERELADGDFTSGVYASAVTSGDLTLAQLRRGDREEIRQGIIKGRHEERFWAGWHEHRRYLLEKAPLLHSFDFRENVRGLERLICLHLGSRGYK